MRNTQAIMVQIEDQSMKSEAAAEFLGVSRRQLLDGLRRNKGEFKYEGFTVKRVTPQGTRKGTKLVRASDHKEWESIFAFCSEAHVDVATVQKAIRTNQRFELNNEVYFAPDYKERHRKCVSKLTDKRLIVDKVTDEPELPFNKVKAPEPELLKEEVKEQIQALSLEQQAITALKRLAHERIDKMLLDKTDRAIAALRLLTE